MKIVGYLFSCDQLIIKALLILQENQQCYGTHFSDQYYDVSFFGRKLVQKPQ